MNLIKKNLLEILLINSFILVLFTSMISNYTTASFVIKTISVVILYFFIFVKNNVEPSAGMFRSFNKELYFVFLFLAYAIVSIIYSQNAEFGLLKLLNIILSVIPLVYAAYYLIATSNEQRIKLFFYTVFTIGIISTILVIAISPFDYSTLYSFGLFRWSHVTYGRFISLIFLISLFVLFEKRDLIKPLWISISAGLFLTGVYLSGLRAAMLGVIMIFVPMIIVGLRMKKISFANLAIVLCSSVFLIALLSYSDIGDSTSTKYDNTIHIGQQNEISFDDSWLARIEGWSLAYDMIKERPVFGSGLGGFRRYYKSMLPEDLKYPHNIFIEVGVELGIVGLIGLLIVLFLIFNNANRISIYWVVYLGFSLWLALFAKDLSTNTILWLGIALIPLTEFGSNTN